MLSTTYVQILLLGPVLSSKLKSYIPSLSKLVTCSSLDSHLWNSEYHAVHWRDLYRMDMQRLAKRRGFLLSYSQSEPRRALTQQPRKHLLAEPCTYILRLTYKLSERLLSNLEEMFTSTYTFVP